MYCLPQPTRSLPWRSAIGGNVEPMPEDWGCGPRLWKCNTILQPWAVSELPGIMPAVRVVPCTEIPCQHCEQLVGGVSLPMCGPRPWLCLKATALPRLGPITMNIARKLWWRLRSICSGSGCIPATCRARTPFLISWQRSVPGNSVTPTLCRKTFMGRSSDSQQEELQLPMLGWRQSRILMTQSCYVLWMRRMQQRQRSEGRSDLPLFGY